MKNSADQGGCYPQRPKAEVDNTLRDLQNGWFIIQNGTTKFALFPDLRRFPSFALRIPTAHDVWVISARTKRKR